MLFRRVHARYARRHWVRTTLTVVGVTIGVGLTCATLVTEATLNRELDSADRNIAGAATLEVAAADATGIPAALLSAVEQTPGVAAAVPVDRSVARLFRPGSDDGPRVLVLGLTNSVARLFETDGGEVSGIEELSIFLSNSGLFLTRRLASSLGVRLGDTVEVETPRGLVELQVAAIGAPAGDRAVIVQTPSSELRIEAPPTADGSLVAINGGNLAVLSLPTEQEVFGRDRRLDAIYVLTADGAETSEVARALRSAVKGAALVGEPGIRARAAATTLRDVSTLVFFAAIIALVVGAIIVFNSISLSLSERRADIANELALGATVRAVALACVIEAVAFGLIAAALGIGLGVLGAEGLTRAIVHNDPLLPITETGPMRLGIESIVISVLCALFVPVLGALASARSVSQISPLEALRPAPRIQGGTAPGTSRRVAVVAGAAVLAGAACLVLGGRRGLVAGVLLLLLGVTAAVPILVPACARLVRRRLPAGARLSLRAAVAWLTAGRSHATTTITVLALAGAAFLGIGAALSSFEHQVTRDANEWNGAPLFVRASSYAGLVSDQPLPLSFAEALRRVPGVGFVFPWRYSLFTSGDEQAVVYAVPVAEAARQGATTALSSAGGDQRALIAGLGRGEIAVSRFTARRRDLHVGDSVVLPTPTGAHGFRIAATFDDLASFDSYFLEYSVFSRLWDDRRADRFGLLLDDGADPAAVMAEIDRTIRRERLLAEVVPKQTIVDEFRATLQGVFSVARAVQLAALIGALLILANTLTTTGLARRWEFALQRALGMTRRQIVAQVVVEAAAMGLLAGLIAAVLGNGLGWAVTRATASQFAWRSDFQTPVPLTLAVILGSALVASAVALYPGWLATRGEPSTALRRT